MLAIPRRYRQQMLRQRAMVQRNQEPNVVTLPPPVGGLNSRDAWTDMDPADAILLDNWYPDVGKCRVRGGTRVHATCATANPVETLAELHTGSTRKLLAAAGGGFWDVTAGGTISTAVGGTSPFSSNRWQTANMNGLLALVNGANTPQTYDGTNKAAMAVSGSSLAVTQIIGVNVHRNRSYFWTTGSQDFWYSAVNTLGGPLTLFPLADLAKGGGHLVTMLSWTRSGGAGMENLAVFLMSSGDVIIYDGSNPGDAANWSLVGVFKVGSPVGARAVAQLGGEVLIVTADGYSLLSKSLSNIRGTRGTQISDKITGDAVAQVRASGTLFGWQALLYPRGHRIMINHPTGSRFSQHVVNLSTGAWGRFRDMDARCWSLYADAPYFGSSAGKVYEADTGFDDAGTKITALGRQAYSYLGSRNRHKQVQLVGPLLDGRGQVPVRIGLAADFDPELGRVVSARIGTPAAAAAAWGVAEWGVAEWGARQRAITGWLAHAARGYAISPSIGVEQQDDPISWSGTRIAYERAGIT